jgi:hypothetical protein
MDKGTDQLEDQGVDARVIIVFKWIVKKYFQSVGSRGGLW